jgi:hypothetical protein
LSGNCIVDVWVLPLAPLTVVSSVSILSATPRHNYLTKRTFSVVDMFHRYLCMRRTVFVTYNLCTLFDPSLASTERLNSLNIPLYFFLPSYDLEQVIAFIVYFIHGPSHSHLFYNFFIFGLCLFFDPIDIHNKSIDLLKLLLKILI